MSRKKRNHSAKMAATSAGRRAAAQVKPVTAQMRPLAQTTGAAAIRRVHRTRAWAARRLEPAKPQRTRWRKLAGISVLAAAAGAAVGFARNLKKPDSLTSVAEA